MTDKLVTNFLDKLAGKEQQRAEASAAAADAAAAVLERTETPDIGLDQVPQHSDDWLALIFTNRHDDLRYCAAWNKWLRWDNTRWLVDETKQVFDLARKICREVAVECRAKDPQTAKQLVAAKRVAAVVMLAQSDRVHAATVDQWDADPWLLNTPDYVIDLRTGVQRTHSPEDYITRLAAVSPGGECRTWHAFLDRVTAGDKELQSFLQRVAGYSLTGITTEHALFFLYGKGANGKSVFVNTIAGILADYHKTAPIETFTASHGDRHPTDLARLRGARAVTATETEEGRRWAESRIKALTGGDRISARFMRQDFFEYMPQFKLIIAGNHKPGLRSVDEAIRRRFNLVPFTVTIPPDERDPKLTEKLKAEWPGILQWMVAGCLEWQRIGLAPPKVVTEATAAYLEAEDAVLAWTEECCEFEPDELRPARRSTRRGSNGPPAPERSPAPPTGSMRSSKPAPASFPASARAAGASLASVSSRMRVGWSR